MLTEREWAEEQISTLGLSPDQQSSIRNLLNCYWTARDVKRLSKTELDSVLRVFSSLARGVVLTADSSDKEEVWIQTKPGNIHMRDTVRVKADAYSGQAAINHNGRLGVVVGLRPDDIRVRYTDGKDYSPPYVSHRTQVLEKRIR